MTDLHRQKKEALSQLSKDLKELAEQNNIEHSTVNELLRLFYNPDQSLTFNTFKQWKENGFFVLKGSQAYLFWGKPLGAQSKENEGKKQSESNNENNSDDKDDYHFFPLCYLFSNEQVTNERQKQDSEPENEPNVNVNHVTINELKKVVFSKRSIKEATKKISLENIPQWHKELMTT